MFSLISQIQFANLSGLLLAIAAPLLIFAYMRTRSKKPIFVSSALILNRLSKRPVAKSNIKLPLRFFFELLALLLLCLAATHPSFKDVGRVALVIDNSLSMGTRLSQEDSKSRFEAAKTRAIDSLAELGAGSAVSVYASSPNLQAQGTLNGSISQARQEIEKISIVLADDSLNSSLNELIESSQYDKVTVFSDRYPLEKSPENESPESQDEKRTVLDFIQLGEPISNFFVSEVAFSSEGILSSKERIKINVSYSGVENPTTSVTLYTVALNNPDDSRQKKRIDATDVTFSSKDKEVYFDIPSGTTSPLYRVELGTEDSLKYNANPLDDIAWISQEAVAETRVLLVSQFEDSAEQGGSSLLGLSKIPSMRVNKISPQEYGDISSEELKRYSLIIFHQTAPIQIPKQPILLVLPPAGNNVFPIRNEIESPKVTSWTGEHPITTYLRVQLLSPGRSAVLDIPSWATSIINSEYGPLVAAGERQGVRIAASGMELLPFEGSKTPSASVLTLNLLNWLRKGAQISSSTLTGSLFNMNGLENWIVIEPNGAIHRLNSENSTKSSTYRFPSPGPYLISAQANGIAQKSELLIVNSFFPEESSTLIRHPINSPKVQKRKEVISDTNSSIWKYLIYFGLTFLLFEFLLRFRKTDEALA